MAEFEPRRHEDTKFFSEGLEFFLEVEYEGAFAAGFDFVAFGAEFLGEGGDAAGVFGVEFAVVFEGSPVGGDFGGLCF